jgi:hypothetical protein
MNLATLNLPAVFAAALSTLLLGGIWYSPALFGKKWMRACGFTADDLKRGNTGAIFGLAFVFALVMAANLAMFLNAPGTTVAWGATAGVLAGFGWVTLSIAIIALFERRPWSYILINGGYMTLAFALMGAILGAWRR